MQGVSQNQLGSVLELEPHLQNEIQSNYLHIQPYLHEPMVPESLKPAK